jgi:hypothetical protein
VGIVFFLLCFCLVSDLFVFFRSVCVYFAVMFVLFVENAKGFSLKSFVACTSSDCAYFESVMVDVRPRSSKYCGERSIFLLSICSFPKYSIARTNKGFGAVGRVHIYLIWLDLSNMVLLGDWDCYNESDGCDCGI